MQNPYFIRIHIFQLGKCDFCDHLFDFKRELFDEMAALRALWGSLRARFQGSLQSSSRLHSDPVLWKVCLLFHEHLEVVKLNVVY